MQRKKLLVLPGLFPKFKGDATGIFVLDYIDCVKHYCDTTVLFLRLFGEPGLRHEEINGIKVVRYCLAKQTPLLKLLKPILYILLHRKGIALAKQLDRPDVIHAHGAPLNGALALKLKKIFNAPVVITEHTGPFSKLTKIFFTRFATKKTIEACNVFLTVSNDLKMQVLASGIKPKCALVSFNPVDTTLFAINSNTPLSERKRISFCARLEDYKGGLRVVKAYSLVKEKLEGFKLCIIGNGPEEALIKKFILENNLTNNVEMIGKAVKSDIADVYNRTSFFVFPSEHETFGLVIAEAMACGLPVIVGNETAPKEIVRESDGILITPKNVNEIADAMVKMKDKLSDYNSEKIRQGIVERFGFESFGKFLNKVYDDAIISNK
ncbi:MAG TPA: glycosyltransferase [Bacteroidia bacterium]|nr:glycosyltransferase [Bacteroidia bacterium]HNU33456.1 glycosyltransferase [Bacteroidia bacterium]